MLNRDSTEILVEMFKKGMTDELIDKNTKYEMDFIKEVRYIYNLFKEEEE